MKTVAIQDDFYKWLHVYALTNNKKVDTCLHEMVGDFLNNHNINFPQMPYFVIPGYNQPNKVDCIIYRSTTPDCDENRVMNFIALSHTPVARSSLFRHFRTFKKHRIDEAILNLITSEVIETFKVTGESGRPATFYTFNKRV